jgi:hypothetical protein
MQRNRHAFASALCAPVLLTFLLVSGVRSQTNALSMEELTRQSEVVAVGKVTATKAEWDRSRSRIVTRVSVAVGEYLKGNVGSVMTITSLGGEVGGVGEWYSHTARFQKDEDVVVFVARDKNGNFRVAGGQEGKLSIRKDDVTGQRQVSATLSLDDLRTRVRNAVHVQGVKY